MKKAITALILAVAFWNLRAVEDVKEAIVELLVIGRVPGTEVYLDFTATLIILAVLLFMLFGWARQLMTDLIDFNLEQSKLDKAKRLAKELTPQEEEPKTPTLAYPDNLTDDELDLLSV